MDSSKTPKTNRVFLSASEHEESRELGDDPKFHSEVPSKPFDDTTLSDGKFPFYVTGMALYIRRWDTHTIIGGIKLYYNNGHSVLHGSDGYGPEFENYEFVLSPGEYIVSIHARAGFMVDQLEFTTNLGNVYGPYGGNGGNAYSLKSPLEGAYLAYTKGVVDVVQGKTAVRKLRFVWGIMHRG